MELKIDQTSGHFKIELEGVDITKGVRHLEVSIDPHRQRTIVLFNLEVDEFEMIALAEQDATMMVTVSPDAERALQAIGWVKTSDRTMYTYPREDSVA